VRIILLWLFLLLLCARVSRAAVALLLFASQVLCLLDAI